MVDGYTISLRKGSMAIWNMFLPSLEAGLDHLRSDRFRPRLRIDRPLDAWLRCSHPLFAAK